MRAVVLGLVVFALGLATAALVASPRAGARATAGSLSASVGPGFTISMSADSVTEGAYTITVSDQSAIHNFHLSGPGVNKATSISGQGTATWSVTLQPGTYSFVCDAHAATMNGSLTVTAATTTSTAATTTTTASTTTTTTQRTTTQATTSQETTTAAETTTVAETTTAAAMTTTEATTTQPAPPPPLHASIASAHAAGRTLTVKVSANRPGRGVASLFAGKHRLAHAAGRVPGRLVLRAAHRLRRGRYVLRVRVTAGGATVAKSRAIRMR
jgi:hypothetical protein